MSNFEVSDLAILLASAKVKPVANQVRRLSVLLRFVAVIGTFNWLADAPFRFILIPRSSSTHTSTLGSSPYLSTPRSTRSSSRRTARSCVFLLTPFFS